MGQGNDQISTLAIHFSVLRYPLPQGWHALSMQLIKSYKSATQCEHYRLDWPGDFGTVAH
jgi:hypothetical protein